MGTTDIFREAAVSTWMAVDNFANITRSKVDNSLTFNTPEFDGFSPLFKHVETRPKAHWSINCAADSDSESYRKKLLESYPSAITWTSGVIRLERAKANLKYGVHMSPAGGVLSHFCGDQTLKNPKYALPMLTLPLQRARSHFESAIMLLPPWHHNFYHWVIDIMPRLKLLDEAGVTAPLVLPSNTKNFVKVFLNFLEKDFDLLDDDVHSFDELYLPTAMSPSLDISQSKLTYLRGEVLPSLLKNTPMPTGRRIYISRSDANIRKVDNEDELILGLKSRGFEIVIPTTLTINEQIAAFAGANFVVGPHGAAFANMAFAEKGTKFIEIFQKGHFSPSYYRISEALSHPYGVMVAKPEGINLFVDKNKLFSLIDQMDEQEMKS